MLNEILNRRNNLQVDNVPSATLSLWERRLENFNSFMDFAYSKPMEIVDYLIDGVLQFINGNPLACGCCLCTAITTTIGVTSIAIGVGIGVGVGCSQIEYIYTNYTNSSN